MITTPIIVGRRTATPSCTRALQTGAGRTTWSWDSGRQKRTSASLKRLPSYALFPSKWQISLENTVKVHRTLKNLRDSSLISTSRLQRTFVGSRSFHSAEHGVGIHSCRQNRLRSDGRWTLDTLLDVGTRSRFASVVAPRRLTGRRGGQGRCKRKLMCK